MEIRFLGAAGEVTGSKHLVRTERATVLLDCGLFQGRRREAFERNRKLGFEPHEVDAVVLSHAHLDHAGGLPLLVKAGYEGPIYATPATRDLCAAMLEDAALVQQADCRYVNKAIAREGAAMDPVEPLYDEEDVARTLEAFVSVPYHRTTDIAPGVRLTLVDAGHVLGSAVVALDLADASGTKRLVYSGDVGRRGMPILRDPQIAPGANALVLESTYGGRQHPPIAAMDDELATILERTIARRGKVVIPAFALERAQEILYTMKRLEQRGRLPKVPVYVDSPLAIRVTEVFRLHPECFDRDARRLVSHDGSPFDLERLVYVDEKEDSQAIDASSEPCVILAGSGMCEGGRVVHHLKAMIADERHTIVIVGFQAQHTLGRRIVERRPRVRMFGVERDLRAEVAVLNGFSAHADERELVAYAEATAARGSLGRIALVHGEAPAREALGAALARAGVPGEIVMPEVGETMEI